MHKTCEIMNSTCDMLINKLSLMLSSQHLHCTNLERAEFLFSICATYANCNSHCLTFKSFVISFAWFSALMLSSFIDVSLCSVDAAHMLSRDLSDQIWIFLWSRLMLLTYASHRLRSFSNPTSNLWMCGAYAIFQVQPDAKKFFRPRLNFSNPPASCTPVGRNTVSEEISVKII